jgi:predicted transcriptional regulator
MKLRALNIIISNLQQFKTNLLSDNDSIEFDSIETFKRVMSFNKLQILMAITRLKPESINKLAKYLAREYPHVLKDCYSLEAYGFIELKNTGDARKQLTPKLVFEYDFIRVKSELEEILPISEKSKNVLLKQQLKRV